MTAVNSAVLFRSKSEGSGFRAKFKKEPWMTKELSGRYKYVKGAPQSKRDSVLPGRNQPTDRS